MEEQVKNGSVAVAEEPVKRPKKKRSRKKKIVLGIVVVLVALFAVNMIVGAVRGPAPLVVATEAIAKGDINQTLSTNGTLVSGNKVTVYSEVSAPVEKLSVKAGSMVTAGDVLVTYNTQDLARAYKTASAAAASGSLQTQDTLSASSKSQTAFNDAAANLNNAAAQKDNAKATLASLTSQYEALADKNTAEAQSLKQAVDAAAADLTAMEAGLQSARAAYDAAEKGVMTENGKKQLEYSQVAANVSLEKASQDLKAGKAGLTAPISGAVSSVSATEGALIGQYSPVCVIESLDDVRVQIALSRYDLEKVKLGQEATITTLGKTYTGKVTTIDSMATTNASANGNTTAYVRAEITLDKPDTDIRLGLEANVTLHTGSATGVITAPLSAINTDVNGQFCYVVENGVAVRRQVKTGLASDSRTEVLEGLSEGDVLISEPQNIPAEGTKVTAMGGVAGAASDAEDAASAAAPATAVAAG